MSNATVRANPNTLAHVAPHDDDGFAELHLTNQLLPGQRFYFPVVGNAFYFPVLSSKIVVSADLLSMGPGPSNPYYSGTGLKLTGRKRFKGLQLYNPSETKSLVFEVFAGMDDYIDN